jgi:protein ImuB
MKTQRRSRSASGTSENSRSNSDRAADIERILEILHKWGIHTLGQFAALNKEDLSLRLGPEAIRLWERATGKSTRLLKLVQPPEIFEETFEFENEIETSEPLLFMLRRFLEQLSLRLGALYLVAKELRLRIVFSDKNQYERRFQIPEPTNNVEVLFRMLHTHLEDFTSEHPIVATSLEASPTKGSQQQFRFFETAMRDPARLSETLARLNGLLGPDRVGRPVLEETHRPDAFHIEPFSWQSDAETPAVAADDIATTSCVLRRFRPAHSASVIAAGEKPTRIRSREIDDAVVAQKGPFMASGNWWDEKAWARSEWDVKLNNGALCRCHEHQDGWAVDGIYD